MTQLAGKRMVAAVSRVLRLPAASASPGSAASFAAASIAAMLMLAAALALGVLVPAATGEFHYFQPSERPGALEDLVRPTNEYPGAAVAYFTIDSGFVIAFAAVFVGLFVLTKETRQNKVGFSCRCLYGCAMAGTAAQVAESVASRYAALRPHLDERQRRLLLGVEAQQLGRGGIKAVAEATGVHPDTIARGVREVEGLPEPSTRVRAPGGGRKKLAETDPDLASELKALVDPETRGDPMSLLVWTTKSTRNLAGALTATGHPVSDRTVARMLRAMGFSLQGNAKAIEGRQHDDRDAQFRYLNQRVSEHVEAGQPVVSVDTKKKELVGEFKNDGREYQPKGSPERVNVHDFMDKELGKAIPYGIYDVTANASWVSVGTDHDTSAFAVQTLRRWWETIGSHRYPHATKLLICADGGGSNGYRRRAWKIELAKLAADTGLTITVCHLPPGTSKWNKIEHRLFSQITMNWRGRPLKTHQTIVDLISNTTTTTGLTVHCVLDTDPYPTGIKYTKKDVDALPITRHDFHGEWNYTVTRPDTP